MKFRAGMWLDVFVPGLARPGGFTITSTPAAAAPGGAPALELAVQHSPANPPAAWLWRPVRELLGQQLLVRPGGDFCFPPRGTPAADVRRLVLVAGGVGINPLVAVLADLVERDALPPSVHLLYGTKTRAGERELTDPSADTDVLFLRRLHGLVAAGKGKLRLSLFATNWTSGLLEPARGTAPAQAESARASVSERQGVVVHRRRLDATDLGQALDIAAGQGVLCYVCGPRKMTDELVAAAKAVEGMRPEHVLCEKWW